MTLRAICRDCLWSGDQRTTRCPACDSRRVISHDQLADLTIAHLDCDAFYASVEKRDRPELRDRPVIVGGGRRGVASTCCYIARQYGVHSAMPMFKALKACPEAVVIKPDFSKYVFESKRIFDAIGKLTPLVQTLSLDEAWIGLAANRFLAKIASELDKPRGFSVIGTEAPVLLAQKPVNILPGVGPVFSKTLRSDGYATIGDLAAADPRDLIKRYGESGLRLHDLANGRDARAVKPGHERKGMSAETTFNEDLTTAADLEAELWPLCEKLASKARRDGVASRVIMLKLRRTDFRIITRRISLAEPVQTARALFAAGRALMTPELGTPYRLIGIGMGEVSEAIDAPSALFENAEARTLKTETAIDALRAKFGKDAVVAGRALKR